MKKAAQYSGLNFSVVAQCFLRCAGRNYTIKRMRTWVCDEVGNGAECNESDFSNSVNRGKPLVGFAYDFYENAQNLPQITELVQRNLLDVIPSVSVLMEQLNIEVSKDTSILPEVAEELLSGTDAEQVAKILRYSIIRQQTERQHISPAVEAMLDDVEVPARAPKVIGREQELEEIRERLVQEKRLFVSGIGGVGKSEITQEYARRYRKEYANCIYLTYQGSIHNTIAEIRLKNEVELASPHQNYERNLRLLKSLKEDSLLLIDNLDELPEKSGDLEVLDKLRCHVLVTTRLQTWGKRGFFLGMIQDRAALMELFYSYCPKNLAGSSEDVWELIELVHHHTYAIQLIALTVKEQYKTSREIVDYIHQEGLAFSNSIYVESAKDGIYDWKPFFALLEGLFRLQKLDDRVKKGLMQAAAIPDSGIHKGRFVRWTCGILEMQTLLRLGWVQEDENTQKIFIHGLVREMVLDDLKPTFQDVQILVDNILNICQRYTHYYKVEDYQDAVDTIGCNQRIGELLCRHPSGYDEIVCMLFAMYQFHVQHRSVEMLYVQEMMENPERKYELWLQMRTEQYHDLRSWLLKNQKKCEKTLQKYQSYEQNYPGSVKKYLDRAIEEYQLLAEIYKVCRAEVQKKNPTEERIIHLPVTPEELDSLDCGVTLSDGRKLIRLV